MARCRPQAPLAGQEGPHAQPHIVVVGAGMAGLAAASRLYSAGLRNVTVVEARPRLGGRIFSVPMGQVGATRVDVADLGAKWILGEGLTNPVNRLMKDKPDVTFELMSLVYSEDGRVMDSDLVRLVCSVAEEMMYDLRKLAQADRLSDLKSFIDIRMREDLKMFSAESQYDAEQIYCTFVELLTSETGLDWRKMDADSFCQYSNWRHGRTSLSTGFGSVLLPLIKSIPKEKILLSKQVAKIGLSNECKKGCRVTLEICDGDELRADFVVSTLPISVLKVDGERIFDGHLSNERLSAIDKVQVGLVNKIYLQYDEPWWNNRRGDLTVARPPHSFLHRDDWSKGVFSFNTDNCSQTLISCQVGSREAFLLEQCSTSEVIESVTNIIRACLGDISIPYPNKILISKWGADKFSRGSHLHLPNHEGHEIVTTLSEPIDGPDQMPAIFFAGDGMCFRHFGTVQAAYVSGVVEAERIIDVVRGSALEGQVK